MNFGSERFTSASAKLDAIERLESMTVRGGSVPRDERLRSLGYRYLVEGPYLIFYERLARQVRVYRVIHGKRVFEGLL